MATPAQMTRKLAREIKQAYKIHQHFKDRAEHKAQAGEGSGQKAAYIKGYYMELTQYNWLLEDRFNKIWEKLRIWSNLYGMPLRFENPLSGKIRLNKMMMTTNELTNDQVDNYVVVNENFKDDGNKYERFLFYLDCLIEFCAGVNRRLRYWQQQWDDQGSNDREKDIAALLAEDAAGFKLAESVLGDLLVKSKEHKGNAESVPELRLRRRYNQPRARIQGGIYAINRGVTTTAGVPGGDPLTGVIEPDEIDFDINVARDEPPMGTDAT